MALPLVMGDPAFETVNTEEGAFTARLTGTVRF
jgi:hypothetical protein